MLGLEPGTFELQLEQVDHLVLDHDTIARQSSIKIRGLYEGILKLSEAFKIQLKSSNLLHFATRNKNYMLVLNKRSMHFLFKKNSIEV